MVYMVDLSFSTAFLRTAWDRVYFSIEEITLIYSTHTRYIYSLIMLYIQCIHIYMLDHALYLLLLSGQPFDEINVLRYHRTWLRLKR